MMKTPGHPAKIARPPDLPDDKPAHRTRENPGTFTGGEAVELWKEAGMIQQKGRRVEPFFSPFPATYGSVAPPAPLLPPDTRPTFQDAPTLPFAKFFVFAVDFPAPFAMLFLRF